MSEKQIFISYCSKNRSFARRLYEELLSAGYWVWMDPSLKETEPWKPQIEYNLRKSNRFIVLISYDSVHSDWVKHEGSMAYALEQLIIPLKIEDFGRYSASDLPIWVAEIQLFNFVEGTIDYPSQLRKLKQRLGDPLPIQKHLEEMVLNYQTSNMLLDEVALNLIEMHKDILVFPKGAKALIEKSKRALDDYWTRYDNLERDYLKAQLEIVQLNKMTRVATRVLRGMLFAIFGLILYYLYTYLS